MLTDSSRILARLKFNDDIVFFQIKEEVLIVSVGGSLFIFSLKTLTKLETLQCSSIFETFMTMRTDDYQDCAVDVFRIIY